MKAINALHRFFLSLAAFSLLLSLAAPVAFTQAATDENDWPDDIEAHQYDKTPEYFDMNKSTNPILKKYMQLEQADHSALNGNASQAANKPTQQKKKKQKVRPLTNAQVTRVGPRETLPTKDPLLALPVKLALPDGGSLPSGFYLVKQEPVQDPENRRLFFVRENKTLFTCTVHRTSSPTSNADSPLSITNPKLPSALSPIMKVMVAPANENRPQTATLVLQEGGDRFESEPFGIISDKRPPIRSN